MRSGYANFFGHQSKIYYSLLYSEHCGEKATQRRRDCGSASLKEAVSQFGILPVAGAEKARVAVLAGTALAAALRS
jgi:hypothetical protein